MLVLTDTQKATVTLEPKNSKGNPAPVDGVPQWSSSNPAVATVEPSTDGMTAVVKAVTVGSTQISAVVDADLDPGTGSENVREITGTLDVDVKASEAVTMGLTAGTPEEQ
jgi:uncharacterized protein YjdB